MTTDLVRARTALGHYARLLSPDALSAARLPLHRDTKMRIKQLGRRSGGRRRAGRQRMRGLVAYPGGALRWRSLPSPAMPGPQAAIVRPIAVATCDVDRAMMLGRTPFPLPLHLGHECVAEVVDVGTRCPPFASAIGWWCHSRSAAVAVRPAGAGTPAAACRCPRRRCTGSASPVACGAARWPT